MADTEEMEAMRKMHGGFGDRHPMGGPSHRYKPDEDSDWQPPPKKSLGSYEEKGKNWKSMNKKARAVDS